MERRIHLTGTRRCLIKVSECGDVELSQPCFSAAILGILLAGSAGEGPEPLMIILHFACDLQVVTWETLWTMTQISWMTPSGLVASTNAF